MKYISLLLYIFFLVISNAAKGQPPYATDLFTMGGKDPKPVSNSQKTGHQDDPNKLLALCRVENETFTLWIEIDGASCAGNLSPSFPTVIYKYPMLSTVTATHLLNDYYYAIDPNSLSTHYYYRYTISTGLSGGSKALSLLYFVPQPVLLGSNDSTYCRDTIAVFIQVCASSTCCLGKHSVLLKAKSAPNCPDTEADAGMDMIFVSNNVSMSPLPLGATGTWSGGNGTWVGNVYTPDSSEKICGDTIHAIWSVKDDSCLCMDIAEALITFQSSLPLPVIAASRPITMYPNPTNGLLHIDGFYPEKAETAYFLSLYNALGQVVVEKTGFLVAGKLQEEVGMQHLPQGVYFVRIKGEGYEGTGKVVKD